MNNDTPDMDTTVDSTTGNAPVDPTTNSPDTPQTQDMAAEAPADATVSMTHSLQCPIEGCTHVIEVQASSDDDAVQKLMAAGKAHFAEVHPTETGMTDEQMEQATRAGMQAM